MATTESPYTLEEQAELDARPVSTEYVDFTEAQLVIRVQIAKKIHDHVMREDADMPSWARECYAECPMWGFYTNADFATSCIRVYGAMEDGHAHAEISRFGCTNNVVGGVLRADLQRVDRWSEAQKQALQLNNVPGWFLDPIAFVCWIQENN